MFRNLPCLDGTYWEPQLREGDFRIESEYLKILSSTSKVDFKKCYSNKWTLTRRSIKEGSIWGLGRPIRKSHCALKSSRLENSCPVYGRVADIQITSIGQLWYRQWIEVVQSMDESNQSIKRRINIIHRYLYWTNSNVRSSLVWLYV